MDKNQIEQFIAANGANFAPDQLNTVRDILAKADDAKSQAIMATSFKNPTTILIIAILIGGYGIDHFMLGKTGTGVAKLLTCGGCGIWAIIDWFSAKKRTYEYNMDKLMNA